MPEDDHGFVGDLWQQLIEPRTVGLGSRTTQALTVAESGLPRRVDQVHRPILRKDTGRGHSGGSTEVDAREHQHRGAGTALGTEDLCTAQTGLHRRKGPEFGPLTQSFVTPGVHGALSIFRTIHTRSTKRDHSHGSDFTSKRERCRPAMFSGAPHRTDCTPSVQRLATRRRNRRGTVAEQRRALVGVTSTACLVGACSSRCMRCSAVCCRRPSVATGLMSSRVASQPSARVISAAKGAEEAGFCPEYRPRSRTTYGSHGSPPTKSTPRSTRRS